MWSWIIAVVVVIGVLNKWTGWLSLNDLRVISVDSHEIIKNHIFPLTTLLIVVTPQYLTKPDFSFLDHITLACGIIIPLAVSDLVFWIDFLYTHLMQSKNRNQTQWVIKSPQLIQIFLSCLDGPDWKPATGLIHRLIDHCDVTSNTVRQELLLAPKFLYTFIHQPTKKCIQVEMKSDGHESMLHVDSEHLTLEQILSSSPDMQASVAMADETGAKVKPTDCPFLFVATKTLGRHGDGQFFKWTPQQMLPEQPLSRLILSTSNAQKLTQHLEYFCSPAYRKFCHQNHIPHKSCLLLSGPAGTAKTTTAMCVAFMLKKHLCRLPAIENSDSRQPAHNFLFKLISETRWSNSILFIDDADFLQLQHRFTSNDDDSENEEADLKEKNRAKPQPLTKPNVVLQYLMRLLDGYDTPNAGSIQLIITTNHTSRFDPALLRPGRIDLHLQLGAIDEDHMFDRLWMNWFSEPLNLTSEESQLLLSKRLTVASVTTALKPFFTDPVEARKQLLCMCDA
jgi:hypothetical protein